MQVRLYRVAVLLLFIFSAKPWQMRVLNAAFREAILLYYYQGYGISEISEMLNLPEGTISSRLSRARKKLEQILKEQEGGLAQ